MVRHKGRGRGGGTPRGPRRGGNNQGGGNNRGGGNNQGGRGGSSYGEFGYGYVPTSGDIRSFFSRGRGRRGSDGVVYLPFGSEYATDPYVLLVL